LPAHPLFPLVQVISSPQLLLNCSRLLLPDLLVGLLDGRGCALAAGALLATGGSDSIDKRDCCFDPLTPPYLNIAAIPMHVSLAVLKLRRHPPSSSAI